jgi:hypothetical protein
LRFSCTARDIEKYYKEDAPRFREEGSNYLEKKCFRTELEVISDTKFSDQYSALIVQIIWEPKICATDKKVSSITVDIICLEA